MSDPQPSLYVQHPDGSYSLYAPGPVDAKSETPVTYPAGEYRRLFAEVKRLRNREAAAIAVLAFCPECRMQHVDRGEWETRSHRSHLCEHCGHVWRLAMVPTVGVAVLTQAGQPE